MNEARATNKSELEIVENVRKHGCHINYVFDPDGVDPNFGYSIGFEATVDQPEVIIFGLPVKLTNYMINETLRQCRDGLKLEDGTIVDGLLEGHRCVARTVPASRIAVEYFNSAMWHFWETRGEPLGRAVQIVWPSATSGLFPWEPECSELVRDSQPALYIERLDS
ncbi:MAG: DUF4262 domain-containing protein [Sphingomonas sp.]|nr:DUF4262 domain-containing protein [Sphingomonas sp.]